MIRICNANGTVLVDVPTGHRLHATFARKLAGVAVGDRLLVDRDLHQVIGTAYVANAFSMSVGREHVETSDERTVITVAPVRRRSAKGPAARLAITTRGTAR